MNNKVKVMMMVAIMVVGTAAFAGPHGGKHHRNEGLELARGIVDLVTGAVRPAPAVVHRPPVAYHRPAPPPPKAHHPHKPAPHPRHKPAKHHR